MSWRLEVSRRARRDLASMEAADRAAMSAALERLTADPSRVDFKKLSGGDSWRLRVGQWRALIILNAQTGVMLVSKVLNRRDAYRWEDHGPTSPHGAVPRVHRLVNVLE